MNIAVTTMEDDIAGADIQKAIPMMEAQTRSVCYRGPDIPSAALTVKCAALEHKEGHTLARNMLLFLWS